MGWSKLNTEDSGEVWNGEVFTTNFA